MSIEHINRALPTAGHTPMYNMHKYFARKQQDVIGEYIKAYTEKGDLVLDPFCGSGVMVGEALRYDRRAIGVDINPVSIFITRNTIRYIEPTEIQKEFYKIKNDVMVDINNLYMTQCRKCKDLEVPAICFTWNKGKLVDARYECPHHKRQIHKVNKLDLELDKKIKDRTLETFFNNDRSIKYWHPTERLYYGDGTPFKEKQQYEAVDELFTLRNLIALSLLYNRIEKITDKNLQESFLFAFSSLTHLASRMTPDRPTRPFSSAWTQQSYWYADNFMESNVWNLFESAVLERQSLIRAKLDLPDNYKALSEARNFEQLIKGRKHHYLLAQSAITALDTLQENTVDYVITDPPYGHSIQYAELLFMWGCWLKLMGDFDLISREEIIENSKQGKGEKEYENMLYTAFRKIYRVLKPGKYCTITFHNPDLKYRNILFRSVVMAGFDFEKIVYQPPPRPSAKSGLQPFGSLEGDYFFRFRKPEIEKTTCEKTVDQQRVEKLVVQVAIEIIAERGEPTPYTFIQNSIDPILYNELRKYGLVMDFQPKSVEKILKHHIGTVFELVDIEGGKKWQKSLRGKGWWFAEPNQYRLDIPLNKRVDEAITNLLRRERNVTFTDVLTEVYTRFQNSLTPEEQTIMEILEENANRVVGGKWEIKAFIRKIHEKHEEMVYFLAMLGQKARYKVDIARDEYYKPYNQQKLSSQLNLEEIKLDVPESQLKRIKNIDVVWHNGSEIKYIFEVEHSTSIIDAIVRGANIPNNNVRRLIVIPNQREDLVYRKFKEPAMESIMKNMEWKVITYKSLETFYSDHVKRKEIDESAFLILARTPLSEKQKKDRLQQKLF